MSPSVEINEKGVKPLGILACPLFSSQRLKKWGFKEKWNARTLIVVSHKKLNILNDLLYL
jgi:hypothetical protein